MYSFLEYCRLLIITLFPETQFHVILVIAPYAKPRNCQNDDFSPADFCWESTWFLVMRDLAFESSDGYYTAAFWLLFIYVILNSLLWYLNPRSVKSYPGHQIPSGHW